MSDRDSIQIRRPQAAAGLVSYLGCGAPPGFEWERLACAWFLATAPDRGRWLAWASQGRGPKIQSAIERATAPFAEPHWNALHPLLVPAPEHEAPEAPSPTKLELLTAEMERKQRAAHPGLFAGAPLVLPGPRPPDESGVGLLCRMASLAHLRRWGGAEAEAAALAALPAFPGAKAPQAKLVGLARVLHERMAARGQTRWQEPPGRGRRVDSSHIHPHDILHHQLVQTSGVSERTAVPVIADLVLWYWGDEIKPETIRSQRRRRAEQTRRSQLTA